MTALCIKVDIMKFSERIGITPVETTLQVQGMNDTSRNSLLNVLDIFIWSRNCFLYRQHGSGDIEEFSRGLWFHYFKKPMDSRADRSHKILEAIRHYYFESAWYKVYDFLEYVLIGERNKKLIEAINHIL